MTKQIILIDFDGTCVTHDFPHIGKDIGAVPVLKELSAKGHKLVLFTMRCDHEEDFIPNNDPGDVGPGKYLTAAVNWFKEHDIPLYGINTNPQQKEWTSSPKAYGNYMIDDTALGCPLKFDPTLSDKLFVDWNEIKLLLQIEKLI